MRFVIRVDGNAKIGMGHITRCLVLANELKNHGSVQFISKHLPVKLPFIVNELPDDCDEIAAMRGMLRKLSPDVVIVDHHELDQDYLDSIKAFADLLVVVDDLKRELCADVIVNVNAFSLKMKYRCANGKVLLGPEYALVGRAGRRKAVRKDADKILVSLGGADVLNLTPKVIQAIKGVGGISATVVIGPAFENEPEIRESAGSDERFSIVRTNNLQKLMLEHDIAVCGGGTTLYELAATGTPSLIVCQAENQLINAGELHKKTLINLGMGDKISADSVRIAVENLLSDYRLRKRLSDSGKRLVDSNGAARVSKAVFSELRKRRLTLEAATRRDSDFVWKLRNEKSTRMNSFSTKPIHAKEHRDWFDKTLRGGDKKLYIVSNNAKRIGYVRIDSGKEIHVAIGKRFRKRGFGSRAIVLACAPYEGMTARIKPGNSASIRAFKNAGFRIAGSDGVVTMMLGPT